MIIILHYPLKEDESEEHQVVRFEQEFLKHYWSSSFFEESQPLPVLEIISFHSKKRIEISNKLQEIKDSKFVFITNDETILATLIRNENISVQNICLISERRGIDLYDCSNIYRKIRNLEEV